MTKIDHYREAEQSLKRVMNANSESDERFHLGVAQVHATLALAAPDDEAAPPVVQQVPAVGEEDEQVAGLRAIADMLEINPQIGNILRYSFNHINVPINIADDPHEALQAVVTAALAHGATPSVATSGVYVGVLLTWGDKSSVELYVYDKPERLGDVAAFLTGGADVEAVDA